MEMRKYILLCVLFASQAQAQWGMPATYFTALNSSTISLRGNYWISKPDMLEYLGDAMKATSASGVSDSTLFYFPMKMFSLSDTATIDFSVSKRFVSLDSIILLGGTISTLGDSAAFSGQVKQTILSGAYAGAFNAAAIDSSDLGAGNVQRRWKFTSFGSLTASARSTIRVKIWRSACTNNTGTDVYLERILIYGVGLR